MGSSHIFSDQYIDKEENSKILVCNVNFFLNIYTGPQVIMFYTSTNDNFYVHCALSRLHDSSELKIVSSLWYFCTLKSQDVVWKEVKNFLDPL